MADAPAKKRPQSGYGWLSLAMVGALVIQLWFAQHAAVALDYSDFKALLGSGRIANLEIAEQTLAGT